jgi:hypothetical protein
VSAREETASSTPATVNNPLLRYVPLAAWAIVVLALLVIPLRIVGMGYLPGGDARRHIAKAFTDKPYTEILVLRPEYSMDHSPGWEWLLKFLHKTAGWEREALVTFSVAGLMLCVFYAPLPWLRRPEAWLAALLAEMIAIPEVMMRMTQARPLLLTEGVLICILFAWSKEETKNPSPVKLTLTTIGLALSVWMHGAWYLWALPIGAFFLARRCRDAVWLGGCVVAGVIAGAVMTGKPVAFLRQALDIVALVSREHLPQWMLVGELQPSYGEFDTLALLALVMLWQCVRKREMPSFFREPAFCMIAICWILGFKADRFWADWGIPAVLVWLAMQFEEILPSLWGAESVKRLAGCALIALPLFLHTTNDLGQRYTFSLNEIFLDANDPSLKGWFPERNGIFYCAQMDLFYNTFYKNPNGDWRYILGLEPALLPDEDRRILRTIQYTHFALPAYEPWVDKMKAGDRLVIYSGSQPDLPKLEWHNAAGGIWIGRLPKSPAG